MSPMQMAKTFFSRTGATLDPAVNQSSKKIKDKRTGKKRAGGYTKKAKSEECYYDEEDIKEKFMNGKNIALLMAGVLKRGYRIVSVCRYGRAPSEWVECFDGIVSAVYKAVTHARQ